MGFTAKDAKSAKATEIRYSAAAANQIVINGGGHKFNVSTFHRLLSQRKPKGFESIVLSLPRVDSRRVLK